MGLKIPEGVSVEVTPGKIAVKGPLGTLEKAFNEKLVQVKVEKGEVSAAGAGKATRKGNMFAKTIEAHLKNMMNGVGKKFEKKLQIIYAHFPVTLEVRGGEITIKNFLGEKTPRKAKIFGKASVEVKGQEITVSGSDVEAVGQTASNIVRAASVSKKDRRVFQDGIYYSG